MNKYTIDIEALTERLNKSQRKQVHEKTLAYAKFLVSQLQHTTKRTERYIDSVDGQQVLKYVKKRASEGAQWIEIAAEMNEQLELYPPARAEMWTAGMIWAFVNRHKAELQGDK